MHVFIYYILVSFFPRRVKLALDKLLQGSWNISNHFNSHIFHGFSSMREVLCSSRLWQCWLQMLFIGSNPGDGAGAGFMLWTVWGWYGLRGNITSPWAGLLCHPAIPAVGKESSQSFPPAMSRWLHSGISKKEVTDHVYFLAGCLAISDSLTFFIFIFCEPLKIQTSQQKTGGKGSVLSIPIAHKA